VENERASAALLAALPGRQPRERAISILDSLRQRQLVRVPEHLFLAQLYEATRQGDKAHALLVGLAKATEEQLTKTNTKELQKTFADSLASICHLLLNPESKNGDMNEAELWLSKLEALEPNEFRTEALRARLLAKRGRGQDAVRRIEALVKTNGGLLRPAAALLEEIHEHAAAEATYKAFAAQAKRPEDKLILAAFFGRRGDADKALALCEEVSQQCAPEAVGGVATAVLYSAKAGKQQCQRVAAWLERAGEKNAGNTALLNQLAAVRCLQGQHQAAIELCRQALAKAPEDETALNNLAWLLALKERRADEALKHIQSAIDLRGPVPKLLDTRGIVYVTLGRHKEAVDDLEEVVAQAPSAASFFHLAQAYRATDQRAAVAAFQEARNRGLDQAVDPLEQGAYLQLRRLQP
jgi:tetratricopeptide (TPR) repeat protein